ncbi:cytochrome P450 [Mycena galericulata]|nr:cytochrome P450 [Mycena galericulata]
MFAFLVVSFQARTEHARVPSEIPWVGNRNEIFGSLRVNWRGLVDSIALYMEGYSKLSRRGLIHVVPTWARGPQIILPPSMTPWLASMPDDILNSRNCTFYQIQFKHTVGHPEITSNDMLDTLINRELARTTGALNADISEEIEDAMVDLFGSDGETRKVSLFKTVSKIVGRANNRVFVGKELSSTDKFVASAADFAEAVYVSSVILHFFPKFMRPAIAWVVTIPNRRASGVAMKYLTPLVQQRITDMKAKAADPMYPWDEPNDFVTWMVRESFNRKTTDETSVYSLAYRIVLLNFAAVNTTTMTATNAILNIWSAPASQNVVGLLREEATRVFAEHNGQWTKAAVGKLVRLDSALRESGRISGPGGTAIARRTKVDLTLSNGLVIPKDNCVGVSMDGIHFDEEYYPRPHEYDAFRFSRPLEDAPHGDKLRWNEDFVTTSPEWLLFSHGLHACPGRFFASNNLKMILAHLLINYEIQPYSTRPPNISMGGTATTHLVRSPR